MTGALERGASGASAAAALDAAARTAAQTAKYLCKIFISLSMLGIHYDTPIPLRIGSGDTTGGREEISDQKRTVALENQNCSSLDGRGTNGQAVDRGCVKCEEREC